MENIETKERRKKILVHKRIQLRAVGLLVVSFLVILVLTIFHIYSFMKVVIPKTSLIEDIPYITSLTGILIIEILVVTAIVCIINIVYMHRLVGPIDRLTKEMEEMINNKIYNKLKIRQKDELSMFVERINTIIEQLIKRQG